MQKILIKDAEVVFWLRSGEDNRRIEQLSKLIEDGAEFDHPTVAWDPVREKWIIPIAAIAGAVASETILTSMQYTRVWGQGLPAHLVASLFYAVLFYLVVNRFRKNRESSMTAIQQEMVEKQKKK